MNFDEPVKHIEQVSTTGILLVTNRDKALVEYAMADGDKDIFVSKYLLELPSEELLIKFINQETISF
jgi:hypothetical protein